MKRKDFHQPFFPQEIFEGYFNVKKKKKGEKICHTLHTILMTFLLDKKKPSTSKVDINDIADDAEDNQVISRLLQE